MGQNFEASVTVRGRVWAALVLCGAMWLAMPAPSAAQQGAGEAGAEGKGKAEVESLFDTAPQPTLSKEARRAEAFAKLPKTVAADENPAVMHYAGMCGASAAITLDDARIVIANDDDNMLRTYDIVEPADLVVYGEDGAVDATLTKLQWPRASQNLYKFLKVNQFSRRNFSAIEGSAVADGFVFWSGSHARREDGENRANRRRFFATKIVNVGDVQILQPHGVPVMDLSHKIEAAEEFRIHGLSRSIMSLYRKMEHLSPQQRGFDIQALAMAKDGTTLLVALRNPLDRSNRGLLLPVENPIAVAEGEAPVFRDAISLDLGGRGISAMSWVPEIDAYLVAAANKAETTGFMLYRWSGEAGDVPVQVQALPEGFDAQSFIVGPGAERLLVLSDDSAVPYAVEKREDCRGAVRDGECLCGQLVDRGRKKFRALWVPLDAKARAAAEADAEATATP